MDAQFRVDVIVIDPNKDSAEVLAELITLNGYSAIAFYDYEYGIAAIRHTRPRLVVTDLGKDGSLGLGVLHQVRNIDASYHPFVVAMTTGLNFDHYAKSDKKRFDLQYLKPIGPEQIDEFLGLLKPH